jgi:hypothetical protein
MRFLLALITLLPALGVIASNAVTNSIIREIRADGESVRVEDRIHLITGTWNSVLLLQDILELKRQGAADAQKGSTHSLVRFLGLHFYAAL